MERSFLLPILFLAFATQACAQIIYTDVVPDALYNVSGDTCHLDLNNDGTTDFYLRYYHPAFTCSGGCAGGAHPSWVKIDPLLGGAVADTLANHPLALITGRVIDGLLDWNSTTDQTLVNVTTHCSGPFCVPYISTGQWTYGNSLDTSLYLGLRFQTGGNTYYGWAHPTVLGNFSSAFTLLEYAYNSVPDEFILAGDTGSVISTGMGKDMPRFVEISPNPFTSTLSVSIGGGQAHEVVCKVRGLTGQVYFSPLDRARGDNLEGKNKRYNLTLDLAALAPGVYLLEVIVDGARSVHRIVRE